MQVIVLEFFKIDIGKIEIYTHPGFFGVKYILQKFKFKCIRGACKFTDRFMENQK